MRKSGERNSRKKSNDAGEEPIKIVQCFTSGGDEVLHVATVLTHIRHLFIMPDMQCTIPKLLSRTVVAVTDRVDWLERINHQAEAGRKPVIILIADPKTCGKLPENVQACADWHKAVKEINRLFPE